MELGISNKIIFYLWNFNGHVGRCAESFECIQGGNGIIKRNAEGRRLLEFCEGKMLRVAKTRSYKADERQITYSAGGCETDIDFVLVEKKYRKYVRDVKMIPWEL